MKNPIFWDYNFKKSDLKNPKLKLWYLSRKLNFGNLKGVTKKDLKQHLSQLQISSSLKELFNNYLKSNV